MLEYFYMHINKDERILVYTNIFFVIPIVVGVRNGVWGITIMLVIFLISSTLYHTFRKPGAEWWWHTKDRNKLQTLMLLLEILLALILSGWSIVLLYQKSLTLLITAAIIFIPGFVVFLSTNYKKYPIYHSIWHITSAMAITLALI